MVSLIAVSYTHLDYAALSADSTVPLLDRVCQGLYAPGSAFKPAVAAAALTAGIDPAATVNCTGKYFYYGNYHPGCLQYGHRAVSYTHLGPIPGRYRG